MIKHICDICHKHEADNNFKIKRKTTTCEFTEYGVFPKTDWLEADICSECLKRIADGVSEGKKP